MGEAIAGDIRATAFPKNAIRVATPAIFLNL